MRISDWSSDVCSSDLIRTTQAYLKDLFEHNTRFAGRSFQQIYHVDFFRQSEKVAECDSWVFRTDRDEARERGTKYTETKGKVVPFTDEPLAERSDARRVGTVCCSGRNSWWSSYQSKQYQN